MSFEPLSPRFSAASPPIAGSGASPLLSPLSPPFPARIAPSSLRVPPPPPPHNAMPSSLFADGSVQGDALDDQRALQIALDQLSLLDLDNDEHPLYDNNQEPRKKSVNMTECVPVPSSEHVAEIVGRQGACFFSFRARARTRASCCVHRNAARPAENGRENRARCCCSAA